MASFYEESFQKELGATPKKNQYRFPVYKGTWRTGELEGFKEFPVFTEDENGDVVIPYYTLQGAPRTWKKEGTKHARTYSRKRLATPLVNAKTGKSAKYLSEKGSPAFPYLTQPVIDKYREQIPIDTLVLTEGEKKAWKGSQYDLDIIGFPGITQFKEKGTFQIHYEVLELIKHNGVKNVVWLVDGDCLELSRSFPEKDPEADLYTRPNNFFESARTISGLLKDYNVTVYFAQVISEALESRPKGLDDLLIDAKKIHGKDAPKEVVKDLLAFSKPGSYFKKIDISFSLNKLRKYFHLETPESFYNLHQDTIGERKFIYHGTKYEWDGEKNELKVIIPSASRNYMRVGDQYYERVKVPRHKLQSSGEGAVATDREYELEEDHMPRQKGTIVEDHGKDFCKHIPKFKTFCNIPDHVNHQQVIHSCWNKYWPLPKEPEEGDCSTSIAFIKHLFGTEDVSFTHPKTGEKVTVNEFELGLDYLQLLYTKPEQKLPILCMVSEEGKTGKSTFGNWLKEIFGRNMAMIGNADLNSDFNSGWVTRLIALCEEAFLDKKAAYERVKFLSTTPTATMNAKGKDLVDIEVHLHFVFFSNNTHNFINITRKEERYWVREIPSIPDGERDPHFIQKLYGEIPAFMYYLTKRKLATEDLDRMHFYPDLIQTEALMRTKEYSLPTIEKEIRSKLENMFLDFGCDTIHMCIKDMKEEWFGGRWEDSYISATLADMGVEHEYAKDAQGNVKMTEPKKKGAKPKPISKVMWYSYPKWKKDQDDQPQRSEVKGNGRPYVFTRELFVGADVAVEIDPDLQHGNEVMNGQPRGKSAAIADDDNEPF